MTMCTSAINRDKFSAGLLNGSDWVFGLGELCGADDQGHTKAVKCARKTIERRRRRGLLRES